MVLHGTTDARLVNKLDQTELVQRAHVVSGRAKRGAKPLRQLVGAGLALRQHGHDPDKHGMAHGLHVARIINGGDGLHNPSRGSDF